MFPAALAGGMSASQAAVQKNASMSKIITQDKEDFLEAKLHEVGSVQHEEDEGHQAGSNLNLPGLNDTSDLTKKHATFD